MTREKQHLDIIVQGKVQGVSYRASTKVVADTLGIKGTVKNLKDGNVQIEAEGDELALSAFLDWCKEGPDEAKVEQVNQEKGLLQHYKNFEVLKRAKHTS